MEFYEIFSFSAFLVCWSTDKSEGSVINMGLNMLLLFITIVQNALYILFKSFIFHFKSTTPFRNARLKC